MCRTECLLAVVALTINLVHSWDIAVSTGDHLELYTNQTKTDSVRFQELTALAYDAVHNMLLFVDKQNDNASIFTYNLATKKYQALVKRRYNENILGLAFDPVKSLLFWTDMRERSIFSMSLLPGSKKNIYGNLLIKTTDEIPRAIAVDSCRGYIYWTNTNVSRATIERARFDGTEREVLVSRDIFMPVSIAVDQNTKRIYWADDKEGIHFSIESSDLDGKDRTTLVTDIHHQPTALAITQDSVYWVDVGYRSIWKINKDGSDSTPKEYLKFSDEIPFGIVGNYPIADQIKAVPECEELRKLSQSQNKTAIDESFNIPRDLGLYCLHGIKVEGKLACKCSPGYSGERCELSLCHNYCLNGDCSITSGGEPTCRCPKGFQGSKCEIDMCHEYCLNSGVCNVNDEQPTCQCTEEYEGTRCETLKVVSTTTAAVTKAVVVSEPIKDCNCTNSEHPPVYYETKLGEEEFVDCNQGWDTVRDPIIVVLGVMCGLLCVACTVLVTRVLHLKRRPRIKKRIIVNKNVTPMTARPDQCEITIENCCNMNICETPCFEPRSTIRPTLGDAKPRKEEHSNLIANMELPDDY